MGPGKGPINDDEGFFVSSDFNCLRKMVWAWEGLINDDKGFFVSADFKRFRKGVWGRGRGPLMMMKDSLFLLVSNVLGSACWALEGAQ